MITKERMGREKNIPEARLTVQVVGLVVRVEEMVSMAAAEV